MDGLGRETSPTDSTLSELGSSEFGSMEDPAHESRYPVLPSARRAFATEKRVMNSWKAGPQPGELYDRSDTLSINSSLLPSPNQAEANAQNLSLPPLVRTFDDQEIQLTMLAIENTLIDRDGIHGMILSGAFDNFNIAEFTAPGVDEIDWDETPHPLSEAEKQVKVSRLGMIDAGTYRTALIESLNVLAGPYDASPDKPVVEPTVNDSDRETMAMPATIAIAQASMSSLVQNGTKTSTIFAVPIVEDSSNDLEEIGEGSMDLEDSDEEAPLPKAPSAPPVPLMTVAVQAPTPAPYQVRSSTAPHSPVYQQPPAPSHQLYGQSPGGLALPWRRSGDRFRHHNQPNTFSNPLPKRSLQEYVNVQFTKAENLHIAQSILENAGRQGFQITSSGLILRVVGPGGSGVRPWVMKLVFMGKIINAGMC